MAGFWICFPLTLISLTGIYLAWPQQGRGLLSSIAPMTEQQRGGPRGQVMANTTRSPADIFAIASAQPNSAVDSISFPNPQTGAWRVRLREADKAEPVTILINDRSGDISVVQPLSGDRTASWIRWLHEAAIRSLALCCIPERRHAGCAWRHRHSDLAAPAPSARTHQARRTADGGRDIAHLLAARLLRNNRSISLL
jgi:hypothetical protein